MLSLTSLFSLYATSKNSENFVDPYTGAHSNTIEGVWSQIKRKLKAMNGTVKSKLPSYLDEYNWRKCYPGDPFDNLLEAIADFLKTQNHKNRCKTHYLITNPLVLLRGVFFIFFSLFISLCLGSSDLSSHAVCGGEDSLCQAGLVCRQTKAFTVQGQTFPVNQCVAHDEVIDVVSVNMDAENDVYNVLAKHKRSISGLLQVRQ
ncbi:PREDICTED: uncharacterized protein LOC107357840 [Acropora digitifera]|uniref:uncharacterized protein LOC107357840 n=1 Tax=Acropora digitifera TaxID=70779 RepID=UPI00077A7469|nr:PREDICTED: uncharacterized protein LOC107357840 [Acropora digitifera]